MKFTHIYKCLENLCIFQNKSYINLCLELTRSFKHLLYNYMVNIWDPQTISTDQPWIWNHYIIASVNPNFWVLDICFVTEKYINHKLKLHSWTVQVFDYILMLKHPQLVGQSYPSSIMLSSSIPAQMEYNTLHQGKTLWSLPQ